MDDMQEDFLCEMRTLKLSYSRHFLGMTERFNISQTMLDVLLFLHHHPAHDTAQDICNLRGIAKSNVSNAVDELVRLGYLERSYEAQNRRTIRLRITPAASELMTCAVARQTAYFERMMAGVAPEDWDASRRVMTQIIRNLSQE